MLDSEIYSKLQKVKGFKGVFPCDRLPAIKTYPSYFVANTDQATGKGEHWVAFAIYKSRLEYFDSFGLPPMQKSFIDYIKLHDNKDLFWSEKEIQDPQSRACGNFCIAYIKARTSGISFKRFLSLFSDNLKVNDKFIKNNE